MVGIVVLVAMFMGVVTLGFSVLSYYHETQRIEQVRFVAERMGFSYWPEADPDFQDRLGHFRLFSQGHSRKIQDVLRREIHDIAVTLFEYRYRINSGKYSQIHSQTVLLFETERLRLPLFNLRPRGTYHPVAGAFGSQGITFEAHPVFSEHYLLRGGAEAQIQDLFAEELLCYYSRHDDLYTEGEGQRLVFYRGDQVVEPGWIESFLEQGLDVLDLFMERDGAIGAVPFLGLGLQQAQTGDARPMAPPRPAVGMGDEAWPQLQVECLE